MSLTDQMIRKTAIWILTGCALFIAVLTAGCDNQLVLNDIEAIKARGELVFVTRNNATCYFEGPHGPTGFEFDLLKAFADHLGVKLRPMIIEEEADRWAFFFYNTGAKIAYQ